MKTVHAPNTIDAYVDLIREAAIANPISAYALSVVALMALCWIARDWF